MVSLICGIDGNVALLALLIDIVVAGLGGVRSEVGRFSNTDTHQMLTTFAG